MWKPGTPITIAVTGTAQQLTASTGLVKAIRFTQHWNNTHNIYWGTSALVSATPVGVLGWLPPTAPGSLPPAENMIEPDSMNGHNANQVYVEGTAGDIVLWSYLEQ